MASIVVAVDFSKPSRKAFEAAVQLADDLGATLAIVHAFAPVPKVGNRDPVGQVKAEVDASEWQAVCKDWATEARKVVEVETVGREGKPAEVIANVVAERKATLVVVGSHGRSGVKRAVLGSVAEDVLRSSKVPVVVVPANL
ncbi:MAG TPA: universal stress protein [Candidatus Thermoplasmatota archaeon]|nr:universal stress protein [Candidatus Thermoplasmatota archaeon]